MPGIAPDPVPVGHNAFLSWKAFLHRQCLLSLLRTVGTLLAVGPRWCAGTGIRTARPRMCGEAVGQPQPTLLGGSSLSCPDCKTRWKWLEIAGTKGAILKGEVWAALGWTTL